MLPVGSSQSCTIISDSCKTKPENSNKSTLAAVSQTAATCENSNFCTPNRAARQVNHVKALPGRNDHSHGMHRTASCIAQPEPAMADIDMLLNL